MAERDAGGPERAGDHERSPGLAPPRPGTRSEWPSAVTLRKSRSARGRVAADDRDAGLRDPFVELDHVLERRLGGAPRVTTSASGPRARGGEVGDVHRGGAEAEVAPEMRSGRKWTPSTSASCVTTSPSPSCAASFSIRRARPRRSSSASSPSSPSVSELHRLPASAFRLGGGADDGDPGRACSDASARVRRVDTADRDHRDAHGFADRARPSSPIGGSASSFDGVAQTGPAPT